MPFTRAEFFAVFVAYNQAIWPLHLAAYAAGVAILFLLLRPGRSASAAVCLLLAALWAINGVGYHWSSFASVNPAARIFAAFFVAESALLIAAGLFARGLVFRPRRDARSVTAFAFIAFSLVVYPLWGRAAGHGFDALPWFGVAPCPTTLFTIGVLLLGRGRPAAWLLVVPVLWTVVGGSAALLLGVPQDFSLLAAFAAVAATGVYGRFAGKPG